MRIAFLAWRDLDNSQAGGSELVVDRLATGLMAIGHETALLCGGPVGRRPYRTVDLGGPYGQYLRAPFAHRAFRDWDVVIDVSNGLPFFAPVWRRGPTVCLVHHLHTDQWGDKFPTPLAAILSMVERRVVPWVYRKNLFVAVSPSTAASMVEIGVPESHVRVCENGIDLPVTLTAEGSEPLFLVLSRLVPHKRVDMILRMWEQVRPKVGGRLVIVGDGPERQRLEEMAGEDVVFKGRVSEEEKAELLGAAWLLVHAAHHEGWGLVIVEAAAAGTPAIAFDVPGVRDTVESGISGELVSSEEQMVAAWLALSRDTGRRATLAAGARRRAHDFTWARAAEGVARVAEEAVGGARPGQVYR